DLELRLKHFPHSLAASGPVYGFEKILRSLLPRFQRGRIGQEVFFFNTEGVLGRRSVRRRAGTDNKVAAISAQAEFQAPKDFAIKSHVSEATLREAPLARAANVLSDFFPIPVVRACVL